MLGTLARYDRRHIRPEGDPVVLGVGRRRWKAPQLTASPIDARVTRLGERSLVVFIDSLLRTARGKVPKIQLREEYSDGQ